MFFDAPFGQLELLGWRPKCDRCIDLAYAGEIVREQFDCPLGRISDAMCEPRSSRYALSAATLRIWSGPGGPTRYALLGAEATSAASLTLASSKSVVLRLLRQTWRVPGSYLQAYQKPRCSGCVRSR